MDPHFKNLQWIETQYEAMISLVEKWANINSNSDNLTGLATMLSTLKEDFNFLQGDSSVISLGPRYIIGKQSQGIKKPVGQVLSIRKRPKAPVQIFLGGHMDTVYSVSSPFQQTSRLNQNTLRGPGVTDMKGGLAIMLKSLETLERSPYASRVGWEIFINSDEEIGSPSSCHLLQQAAKKYHIGLIFEPSFADGSFVSGRKGSATYTIVARGKAAHAGRDFSAGRNAIDAIAYIIRELEELDRHQDTTINVGYIEGGGPVNIVPDLAICRLNIRAVSIEEMEVTQARMNQVIDQCRQRDGIQVEIIEEYSRPPKPFDVKTQALFQQYQSCAEQLGIPFHTRESGGVCDGNILSAAGLPTLDSVGAVGGGIHTEEEYLFLPSLVERTQLAAFFLLMLATRAPISAKEAPNA